MLNLFYKYINYIVFFLLKSKIFAYFFKVLLYKQIMTFLYFFFFKYLIKLFSYFEFSLL